MKQTSQLNLDYSFAKQHGVLLTNVDAGQAHILHRPGLTSLTLIELRRMLACPIQLKEISNEEFTHLLAKNYQASSDATTQIVATIGETFNLNELVQQLPKTQDLLESQDDAPVIQLLNAILTQAIKLLASDIHVETFSEKLVVRFRIDGVLQEMLTLQRVLAPLIVSRIKVMARLDIAEKRLPQDGRMSLTIAGRNIDVRVATLPSNHGERVVLRILDKKAARLDLKLLGMEKTIQTHIEDLLNRPNGILLVTGPTGSGKTTSLYAMLTQLNQSSRNILTVEDPIEYDLEGVGQTQINTKIGMSFVRGLRAILRQDPDIVMVGEIRDLETAEIAVQASLTGHLVLATLHTNSAIGAITRLQDMGVASFLLASSLVGVLAQRLVRLLCNHCKYPQPISEKELALLTLQNQERQPRLLDRYQAHGCEQCNHTGFSGRTGIYELIVIDAKLQHMIHDNASEQRMQAYSHSQHPSMHQDGIRRILAGETSLAEVLRLTDKEQA